MPPCGIEALLAVMVSTPGVITPCDTGGDALPANVALPEYTAETEVVPAGRTEVVKTAVPSSSRLIEAALAPAVKVTAPPGMPPPPLTVAVKLIVWLFEDGFEEELRFVEVAVR
jgi:hypothetical protein